MWSVYSTERGVRAYATMENIACQNAMPHCVVRSTSSTYLYSTVTRREREILYCYTTRKEAATVAILGYRGYVQGESGTVARTGLAESELMAAGPRLSTGVTVRRLPLHVLCRYACMLHAAAATRAPTEAGACSRPARLWLDESLPQQYAPRKRHILL